MSVWRDVNQPTHVWVNISGSIPQPVGPDVTALWQNVWDENTVASSYPRFLLQVLQDLEERYLQDRDVVYFSGHSQGGNVAQMAAFALAAFGDQSSTFEQQILTPSGLPQWPNQSPNTYRELSQRLRCRNITIGGGVAVASRPMHFWAEVNRAMAGRGQAFTYINAIDDAVPTLGVAATFYDDPLNISVATPAAAAARAASVLSILRSVAMIDVPSAVAQTVALLLLDRDLRQNLPGVISFLLPTNLTYDSERARTVAERSHVLFEDDVRPDAFSIHGAAYADPAVTGYIAEPLGLQPPFGWGGAVNAWAGTNFWGPWLNDSIDPPARPTADVVSIDVGTSNSVSIPVLKNDLMRAEAYARMRVEDVRIERLPTKWCLLENVLARASSDGKELLLVVPSASELRAACGTTTVGAPNETDLLLSYALVDSAGLAATQRAFVHVDLRNSAWSSDSAVPSWLNEASSPWAEGPFFWAPPAIDPILTPRRAYMRRHQPQVAASVRSVDGEPPVEEELSFIHVASYGIDCYGGNQFRVGQTVPTSPGTAICAGDMTRNTDAIPWLQRATLGAPVPNPQPRECQDGIPDTAWVSLDAQTSGTRDTSTRATALRDALTRYRECGSIPFRTGQPRPILGGSIQAPDCLGAGAAADMCTAASCGRNTRENPWDTAAMIARAPWLNRFFYSCRATGGSFEGMCPGMGGTIDEPALRALLEEFRTRNPQNVVWEVMPASGGACAPLYSVPLYVPCARTDGLSYFARPGGGAVDVNPTAGLLGSAMWLWHVSYTITGMADRGMISPGDSDGTGSVFSSSIQPTARDACSASMAAGPFGGRAIGTPMIAFPDRPVDNAERDRVGLPSTLSWCKDELILKFSTSLLRCNPARIRGSNFIVLWPGA